MRTLTDFATRHEYERIKEFEARLIEIGNKINGGTILDQNETYCSAIILSAVDTIISMLS